MIKLLHEMQFCISMSTQHSFWLYSPLVSKNLFLFSNRQMVRLVKCYLFSIFQVKDVLFHLYKTARGNLQRLMPKEIRILKYLLTIEDPEERMSALKDAFTPGEELEGEDVDSLYTYVLHLIFITLTVVLDVTALLSYVFQSEILPPIRLFFSHFLGKVFNCD